MSKHHIPALKASDFVYDLPSERIARYPVDRRDDARLLVAGQGMITHDTFRSLPSLLPENSLLVVNSSRVISARIPCRKPTGGAVEVLLTNPLEPFIDPAPVLASRGASTWNCLIGGKNVVEGMTLTAEGISITVAGRQGTEATVVVHPLNGMTLADALESTGVLPLPPYLGRQAEEIDTERYQTVYATTEGSVAAPTAGLHFTDDVLDELSRKGITRHDVLLHVGLGTFKPMEVESVDRHTMHSERVGITRQALQPIVAACKDDTWITVVGTTSLRTLESFYWLGVSLLESGDLPNTDVSDGEFHIGQSSAFGTVIYTRYEALQAVLSYMQRSEVDELWGTTQLMLVPGCHIGTADALITNFHQPGNTLLLLVAAFIGNPFWKDIYQSALDNNYRFLSYGDSSLLIRSNVRT